MEVIIAAGIFIFLFGLCMGSFFNVCIVRVPRGVSLSTPGSHCPVCGVALAPQDMIPLISFLALGRRCRGCGAQISWRYFVVELLTGLLYLAGFLALGISVKLVFYLVMCSMLVVISFIDIETHDIYNAMVLIVAACGAVSMFVRSPWWDPPLGAAVGGGMLAAVNVAARAITAREGIGWGDVKLMAACGLLLGWKNALLALFIAVVVGGLYAAWLLARGKKSGGDYIALAPMLSVGTLAAFLYGSAILRWYFQILGL